MHKNGTDNTNKVDQIESNPLMDVYNPQPAQPEQPARFYWQEPWQETSANKFVQATFES